MLPELVPDIDYHILSFLNARDLCHASEVCRTWKKIIDQDRVWAHFFQRPIVPKPLSLKEHFNSHAIVSINGLLRRIEEFAAKLGLNQNGEFYCLFPAETRCYVAVRVFNKKNNRHHFDKTERYWFMQTFPIQTKSCKEMLDIGEKHNFVLHTRFSRGLNGKEFRKKVIDLLSGKKP